MFVTIVGARPNFMKVAPIHRAFTRAGLPHGIVHTGQHYDEEMSKVFFDQLEIPRPIVDLGVGSGTQAQQTAAVMVGLEALFIKQRPTAVLVVGDVNSTMAAALVAAKMRIYCAHVEAGLRSGDWSMPEEVNRVVTDAVADLLLTPSADADENLLAEGCPRDSIVCVGNVMVDTLLAHVEKARGFDVPARMGLRAGEFAVVTLHRPSNVDDPDTLARIMDAVRVVSRSLPVVFPVHPRTRRRLEDAGLMAGTLGEAAQLRLVDPMGYLDFLGLYSASRLVLTDSGGLQEETTALGIPCLTLRDNTERPITVTQGTNTLVGTATEAIVAAATRVLGSPARIVARRPPLWDGCAAERVVEALSGRVGPAGTEAAKLRVPLEPDGS